MKTVTGKYDVFSKAFAQLSDESQDKLVKIAHHLLKTHKIAKNESFKRKSGKGEQITNNR